MKVRRGLNRAVADMEMLKFAGFAFQLFSLFRGGGGGPSTDLLILNSLLNIADQNVQIYNKLLEIDKAISAVAIQVKRLDIQGDIIKTNALLKLEFDTVEQSIALGTADVDLGAHLGEIRELLNALLPLLAAARPLVTVDSGSPFFRTQSSLFQSLIVCISMAITMLDILVDPYRYRRTLEALGIKFLPSHESTPYEGLPLSKYIATLESLGPQLDFLSAPQAGQIDVIARQFSMYEFWRDLSDAYLMSGETTDPNQFIVDGAMVGTVFDSEQDITIKQFKINIGIDVKIYQNLPISTLGRRFVWIDLPFSLTSVGVLKMGEVAIVTDKSIANLPVLTSESLAKSMGFPLNIRRSRLLEYMCDAPAVNALVDSLKMWIQGKGKIPDLQKFQYHLLGPLFTTGGPAAYQAEQMTFFEKFIADFRADVGTGLIHACQAMVLERARTSVNIVLDSVK